MLTRLGKRVGLSSAILLAAWLACAGTVAWAGDSKKPLPSPIPRCRAEPGEIVREIARIAGEIQDPKQRYWLLSSALYSLRHFPREQNEPVVALLREAAAMIKDGQFLLGTRESLILAAPEAATQVLQEIEDPRHRDRYLTDLVGQLARTKPKQAENLIAQIQGTQYRAEAMAWLARSGKLGYEETVEVLSRAAQVDRPFHSQSLSAVYADSLAPFAVDRPEEVARFVVRHLELDHAVGCLFQMGRRLLYRLEAPETAAVILDEAARLIEKTPAPHRLVSRLIGSGYGRVRPKRALEMFDRLVPPKIPNRELKYEATLASLATIDLETMVDRATRLAEASGWDAAEVVPGVVGRAASGAGRERVLAWLKKTPPGPIRDASIPRLASAVTFSPTGRSAEETREDIRALWEATREIRDRKTRWQACSGILLAAQLSHIPSVGPVEAEFRRLFPGLRDQFDEIEWRRIRYHHFGLIPAEDQRHWIRHWLEDDHRDRFYRAARLLRRSTLPEEEKRALYRQFIQQAQGNRPALTRLAQSVASLDLSWGLELIWSVLPAVRSSKPRSSDADPPENAQVALMWVLCEDSPNWGPSEQMLSKDELPDLLWSWAKEVPEVDRDAVLDRLARVLLWRRQTAEALGVARLIEDRPRRVKLLAEIAAKLHDKENPGRSPD